MKGFTLKDDGSTLSPEFRVSFPKLFQADEYGKFSLSMLFDKNTTDFSVLEKIIAAKIKEVWPKGKPKKEFLFPILDGDDSDREEHENKMYINGKCGKYRPGIVDSNLCEITDESEFYPGCYARAVVTIYHWVYLGKCGVSVNVRNIQKTRDGEPLISRVQAADEFESVVDQSVNDL